MTPLEEHLVSGTHTLARVASPSILRMTSFASMEIQDADSFDTALHVLCDFDTFHFNRPPLMISVPFLDLHSIGIALMVIMTCSRPSRIRPP
jgi:hypothetical protein